MKNLLRLFSLLSLTLVCSYSYAQTYPPFNTVDSINVNNINAWHLVHGDSWWDPSTAGAHCSYPNGTKKNIGFAGSIWMSGYTNGILKVSAQTYREHGNDYWPGPLDSSAVSYTTSQNWAKIWKVSINDINTFLNSPTHTVANTPTAILTWPATGNTYVTGNNNVPITLQNRPYAPFIDVNSNGIYEPLQGDYPALKGDQMLWNIFNDNGPEHSESNGTPLGVEVRSEVYAYHRNSAIDNVVFYDYTIINKSSADIDSFVVGVFADLDIGYSYDDYVGFDSSRNLGITYNALPTDSAGIGIINQYLDTIPMAGIRVLQWNYYDTCGVNTPAGSFMYINNTTSAETGNPSVDTQYNNYLRGKWKSGNHLAAPYTDTTWAISWDNGTGPGAPINYVYTGEPNSPSWSECYYKDAPGDRRMLINSHSITLLSGQIEHFAFALVASPPKYHNGCPNASFDDIRAISDTAKAVYCNPLPLLISSVHDISIAKNQLKIYPNPTTDNIFIETAFEQNEEVKIYDGIGKQLQLATIRKGNKIEIDTKHLAAGVYYILYRGGKEILSNSFIKN